MLVETRAMGTVEVAEDRVVTIPAGLLGFEEYTDFAVVESEYEPLLWLQSLQEKSLAFLLIDPFLIADDYEAQIDDDELAKIGISDPSQVAVFAIVTVPSGGGAVTANLQGPLIFNKKNRQCMQVVLDGSKYTTKHDILGALKRKEGV